VKWLALLLIAAVAAPGGHNRTVPHRTLRHCTAHHRHHCRRHKPPRPRRYLPPRAGLPSAPPIPLPTVAAPVATPAPTAAATAAPTATATPFPRRTSVTMDDTRDPWTLVPARFTLGAGAITFTAYNYGMDDHDLSVDSLSRAVHYGSIAVPAGSADDPPALTLDLPPGRYVLFCNLPGHEAAGMSSTITVQ
jgi:plastocyanin